MRIRQRLSEIGVAYKVILSLFLLTAAIFVQFNIIEGTTYSTAAKAPIFATGAASVLFISLIPSGVFVDFFNRLAGAALMLLSGCNWLLHEVGGDDIWPLLTPILILAVTVVVGLAIPLVSSLLEERRKKLEA